MASSRQNLEKKLKQYLNEEAQKIEPPSSDKLWPDLQQRLEQTALHNMEEKLVWLENRQPAQQKKYTFWKKPGCWAGLAAACLLLFILAAQVPASGIRHYMQEMLNFVQGNNVKTDLYMRSSESLEQSGAPPAEKRGEERQMHTMTVQESFADSKASEGRLPALPAAEEESAKDGSETMPFSIMQEDAAQNDSTEGEKFLPREELFALGESSPQDGQVPQEITQQEVKSFIFSLQENRHLAPEGIWIIAEVQQNFTFQEGTITKTDDFLSKVHQEYINEQGQKLSLDQEFFSKDVDRGRGIVVTDSLAHPIQVGPYSGYLFSGESGLYTITWLQEKSLVSLSGQLKEEELLQVLSTLEEL